MASNIKYPDQNVVWFIEGDKLALVTNLDSTGTTNSTSNWRKKWKAIGEAVTDGILLSYHSEPDAIQSIEEVPNLDNSLHLALVDYVKYCLYMDQAARDPNSAGMVQMHEKRWNDAIRKYGMKKRDKTGGMRAIVPANIT
jgi:hypothetical protein